MPTARKTAPSLLALILFCAAPAAPLRAEDGPPARAARAEPVEAGAIRVDGRLDEAAWRTAAFTGDLLQKDPDEGAPSTRRTEVAFLYDREALYVGARLFTEDPGAIRAAVARRDNSGNAERLIVTFDTYHDRRTAVSFAVTAAGVRIDYHHPEDEEQSRDYSFDPVWEARTARSGEGWTAEMRIPFSQLRFRDHPEQVWGLNLNRWMPDRNEDAYWALIPKEESGYASRFGELAGIEGIRPSSRMEVIPYFAAEANITGGVDDADPFRDETETATRAGADFKMGLGPNLTLEGTVNPDFGQVEADPAEVNLTAYETFFEERRPFFIEGSSLLGGEGPDYFYSRRIGAAPHLDAEGDYADAPQNATILGAAKLTGRLNRGLSLGALGAVTAREYARVYTESTGAFSRVKTEPLTGYGVLRLQQEFGDEGSTWGFMLTGAGRDMSDGEPVASELVRSAVTGGADWTWRFGDHAYALTGHVGFSHVRGDSSAILRVQRSSAHYYQRPDADHVDLDSSRTSLTGHAFALELEKNAGRHWLWEGSVSFESPGFELNDLGELQSADDIDARASLRYRETAPGPLLRDYSIGLYNLRSWNYGGDAVGGGHEINANVTWRNHWTSWCGYYIGPRRKSDSLTRGGPLMETLRLHNAWIGGSTNHASDVRGEIGAACYWWETGGWRREAEATLSVRTGGRWEFSLEPYYGRTEEPRQYVATIDGGREETYGKRYVFSRIERSTARARFRLTYAFHPDLTLEAYAEPFAASGRYYEFGELEAAGSRNLIVYGEEGGTTIAGSEDGSRTVTDGDAQFVLGDRDFRVLSFRSNVVLRWEWRPGSTLYLVWQQNREAEENPSGFVGGRDLVDSITSEGDHFLGLKISYWLPLS
ncbi:MAG: carbohydrate binding family 9 domain-containing protein [Candidatus Eisenbacteria bacterium]|nr:carbohydrate binding family 9 domain-containing protein [Candidatus Eisenbacteria bacterium]